jgi:hypothetical protein
VYARASIILDGANERPVFRGLTVEATLWRRARLRTLGAIDWLLRILGEDLGTGTLESGGSPAQGPPERCAVDGPPDRAESTPSARNLTLSGV